VVVSSDRRFRFDADRDTVWRALASVESYPEWWPWLRDFDGHALAAGERWRCTVQPPLPYRLRFTLRVDEVVEGELVSATLAGDLVGTAHLELSSAARGSEIRLVSGLEPAHVLVRGVARVAQPVARYGHDWVLRTGVRQFAAAL
jgi:uncharacterized protein YndB with AHSA1/START domain